MLTDPIADMLTRIRNANKALHEKATMPSSKMKVELARLLKEEGYIRDYHIEKGESFDTLVVDLKFGRNRERVISGLKRVSKPGRRVYARKDRLPRVLGGMGVHTSSQISACRLNPGMFPASKIKSLPNGTRSARNVTSRLRACRPEVNCRFS